MLVLNVFRWFFSRVFAFVTRLQLCALVILDEVCGVEVNELFRSTFPQRLVSKNKFGVSAASHLQVPELISA